MIEYTPSNTCKIGDLVCMGCCGSISENKEELAEDMRHNKADFAEIRDPESFRNRKPFDLKNCKACPCLISVDEKPKCVIHPVFNKGKELREGYCDILFLCKTSFLYDLWDANRKAEFIKFIKNKNMDWYEYSKGMIEDSLLREFEGV